MMLRFGEQRKKNFAKVAKFYKNFTKVAKEKFCGAKKQ